MAEAALLFRSAASAALDLSDSATWFKQMVWAAVATRYKGDVRPSLALFLEARQSEPEDAPQFEAWLARDQVLEIISSIRPNRDRLEQGLIDFRSYATTHLVPTDTILESEGGLLELCGDWRLALARYEAA
jgi:hypothetical protein